VNKFVSRNINLFQDVTTTDIFIVNIAYVSYTSIYYVVADVSTLCQVYPFRIRTGVFFQTLGEYDRMAIGPYNPCETLNAMRNFK
jgi:hypothetical protein